MDYTEFIIWALIGFVIGYLLGMMREDKIRCEEERERLREIQLRGRR